MVYQRISCLQGPEDNRERSFTTFWSVDAFVWMLQALFIVSSVTFCDQASWQSRIAAKPVEGVVGFIGATFLWFAVPSTIGTTSAIAYLSFSAGNTSLVLPDGDVFAGLVVPYVAQQAMGRTGAFLVLTMFTMLVMSTGSGEVMGVSSIIVYDFFQSYIYPYKGKTEPGHCILCDKTKKEKTYNKSQEEGTSATMETSVTVVTNQEGGGESVINDDVCKCPSVKDCPQCDKDKEAILKASGMRKQMIRHNCTVHGRFRIYQDSLVRLKS
ncbi:hypothetical protein ACOMHN_064105 [Nucella lapillus]